MFDLSFIVVFISCSSCGAPSAVGGRNGPGHARSRATTPAKCRSTVAHMEITPRELRDIEIREMRGYSRDEVNDLLERAAASIEASNERVQQLQDRLTSAQTEPAAPARPRTSSTARCCSRSAPPTRPSPRRPPSRARCSTRPRWPRAVVAESEAEARRKGEAERRRLEEEIVELAGRRDTLLADVEALTRFEAEYRERMVRALEADLSALRNRPPAAPGTQPEPSDVDCPCCRKGSRVASRPTRRPLLCLRRRPRHHRSPRERGTVRDSRSDTGRDTARAEARSRARAVAVRDAAVGDVRPTVPPIRSAARSWSTRPRRRPSTCRACSPVVVRARTRCRSTSRRPRPRPHRSPGPIRSRRTPTTPTRSTPTSSTTTRSSRRCATPCTTRRRSAPATSDATGENLFFDQDAESARLPRRLPPPPLAPDSWADPPGERVLDPIQPEGDRLAVDVDHRQGSVGAPSNGWSSVASTSVMIQSRCRSTTLRRSSPAS